MTPSNPARRSARAAALCLLLLARGTSLLSAQSLSVLPVNIRLAAGERATTLTVTNQGETPTSIQVRAFSWSQADGSDQLSASDLIQVSPPLATLAPGARQIVRIILRRSPETHEDTYRILLDQIPPPAEPGVVHVVLRMSIPVFASPKGRPVPRFTFHLERGATPMYLVATNHGTVRESFRALNLATADGLSLKTSISGHQYVLAGAERRWPVAAEDAALLEHGKLRLTAIGPAGPISQQLQPDATP